MEKLTGLTSWLPTVHLRPEDSRFLELSSERIYRHGCSHPLSVCESGVAITGRIIKVYRERGEITVG